MASSIYNTLQHNLTDLTSLIQHTSTKLLEDVRSINIQDLSALEILKYAALGWLGYNAAYLVLYVPLRFVYRAYIHPLSKVPGPKFTLISVHFTRMYFALSGKQGYYPFEVEKWHKKYGPIVRTSPDIVHINDIEVYNQIFKVATKYPKSGTLYQHPSTRHSLLDITDFHEAHLRRNALQPYFSKQAVRKLESLIQSKVSKLLNRFPEMEVIDLSRAFRCLACDVITTYSYEQCFEALEHPTFRPDWLQAFEAMMQSTVVFDLFPAPFKFFGWLFENFLSREQVRKISSNMAAILDFQDTCRQAAFRQKARWDAGDTEMVTIFKQLFQDDPKKGRPAATKAELGADALLTVSAGMDTTGHTLTLATFYLVKNPDIQKRLLDELKTVMKNPTDEVTNDALEHLPYLQACLKESLRFSHGVPGPLPRDVPTNGANILGYYLPPGTITSNSHYIYHTNPAIFPDPLKFNPDRWLAQDTREQEKYWMPFSRGARICIGMNLAWAELELTLARLIRRYDISFADGFREENLRWRALFVPVTDGQLTVTMKERED
ncbi:hypothetical protein TWF694_008119 [Orbilia ellipsospora]|uniref:Cytochrome P450 n=1 Tax=Orbilia ellipsospora TaxID=2528407 RepID=A0AAV9XIH8_9PEZI